MNKMKTLHLTLNKKWFDMIASGEKKEEYREIKPYWENRFIDQKEQSRLDTQQGGCEVAWKDYSIVSANNGYASGCPNIKWQHKGIRFGEGREEWGAEPGKEYFILEIGELIINR